MTPTDRLLVCGVPRRRLARGSAPMIQLAGRAPQEPTVMLRQLGHSCRPLLGPLGRRGRLLLVSLVLVLVALELWLVAVGIV